MAKCLRCKAGPEWIEGEVKVRLEEITLTPKQIEFLVLVMQDYLDVTVDSGIRRNAKAIKAKLDKVRSSPPISRSSP